MLEVLDLAFLQINIFKMAIHLEFVHKNAKG